MWELLLENIFLWCQILYRMSLTLWTILSQNLPSDGFMGNFFSSQFNLIFPGTLLLFEKLFIAMMQNSVDMHCAITRCIERDVKQMNISFWFCPQLPFWWVQSSSIKCFRKLHGVGGNCWLCTPCNNILKQSSYFGNSFPYFTYGGLRVLMLYPPTDPQLIS